MLICRQLVACLDKQNLLATLQPTYRKLHSTETSTPTRCWLLIIEICEFCDILHTYQVSKLWGLLGSEHPHLSPGPHTLIAEELIWSSFTTGPKYSKMSKSQISTLTFEILGHKP